MEMTKVFFILPAVDARSQILSIKDRRNGIGKLVFKLAPLGSGHTFTLVAPDQSVPGYFAWGVCNGFFLKLTGLMCGFFAALAGRGVLFCGFLFRWVLHLVVYLIRGFTLHESSSYSRENSPWWLWSPMRSSILPSLLCSVASLQPIFIGAGDSVSEGCWSHMFFDILVQRCYMPPSRTHVLGVAC